MKEETKEMLEYKWCSIIGKIIYFIVFAVAFLAMCVIGLIISPLLLAEKIFNPPTAPTPA